jgi:hypothetical protein
MTQLARLQTIDSGLFDVLEHAELLDVATYRPANGTSADDVADVGVAITRGVTYQGSDGRLLSDRIVIAARVEQLGEVPKRGARFTVGGEVFELDALISKDESLVQALVVARCDR